MSFILRRIGFYLLAAWASLTLNFFLPRAMPGDPASVMLARFQGRIKPEELQSLKEAYGFTNGSLLQQYLSYFSHAVRGDFGISISAFPAPVTTVVGTGLCWTLLLGGVATILSFLLGNLLGVIAAWKRGGWVDSLFPPLLTFIGAFPYFFLAMVALFFLGFQLGWFPLRHAYSDDLQPAWSFQFVGSIILHLILPAGTVVLVTMGGWMMAMRNTMISVLAEDYLAMAEAKGLPQRRIMFNYAARNAMLPNVTAFGMALGFVVSGLLLTELVFSYPGLGYLLIKAVSNLDYPLMQGLFLMITFAVLIANLLVDLLYVRLDPRVRSR
jgi:peptide/nickel transport system permease protein